MPPGGGDRRTTTWPRSRPPRVGPAQAVRQPFVIQAQRAVQPTSDAPIVLIQGMLARLGLENGTATVQAERGRYNLDEQRVNVMGPVRVSGPEGERLVTENVTVDFRNRTVSGGAGTGSSGEGDVSAGSVSVSAGSVGRADTSQGPAGASTPTAWLSATARMRRGPPTVPPERCGSLEGQRRHERVVTQKGLAPVA